MRIAVLVSEFPAASETFISRQITGLLDLGHEVDVYAQYEGRSEFADARLRSRVHYVSMPPASAEEMPVRPLLERTWADGSETGELNALRVLRAVPVAARSLVTAPRPTLDVLRPARYGIQAESLSGLYRLSACREAGPYDVVHAHFGPVAASYRFVAKLWDAPLVVSFHGYDMTRWPREEDPAVLGALFRGADAVTAPSRDGLRKLQLLGCPADKLQELHYGVDVEGFPFRERSLAAGESPRLVTVARLTEKKGLEYALRAVARARKHHAGLRYEIVGAGPLRADLEELANNLGVGDAVVLHGARDQAFVRRIMSESHVFVLPSVTAADGDEEGMPVSLMEAQASGLPVLSTRHSGIPEVVLDGRSGLLVAERDEEGLAERLSDLLGHPERWAEMGRAGRGHVEARHDIGALNHQLVDLYRRA